MFENWFKHAQKFLTASDQVVVWPEGADSTKVREDLASFGQNIEQPFAIFGPPASGSSSEGVAVGQTTSPRPNTVTGYNYGTAEYSELVLQTPAKIKHFLDMGCTVMYVDVDTAWLKSPFDAIQKAGSHDFYVIDNTGKNQGLKSKHFCGCFLYIRPTSSAKEEVQSQWLR